MLVRILLVHDVEVDLVCAGAILGLEAVGAALGLDEGFDHTRLRYPTRSSQVCVLEGCRLHREIHCKSHVERHCHCKFVGSR